MNTLSKLVASNAGIPIATTWLLEELAEFRGKQELFANQSPDRLIHLRESAIVESSLSSNRMEHVEVDTSRIGTILFGSKMPRDRNEEEVRGYRKALSLIHGHRGKIAVDTKLVLQFHKLVRGEIWDAGTFKSDNAPIVERSPDGRQRIRFLPPEPEHVEEMLKNTIQLTSQSIADRALPSLVAIAACNLDFLCIHPFRDGNGRVSRLMLVQQLYNAGYSVERYVSIERAIEDEKERYYETLEICSKGWHESANVPWDYINFVLHTILRAYKEFERRWEDANESKGAKTARVLRAIEDAPTLFTLVQIERSCPGISRELIRKVLRELPSVEAIGRGPGAKWQKHD